MFDRLPPRPAHRRVALFVVAIVVARMVLITVYFTLGDLQAGHQGTLARRFAEEASAALTVLPLLAVVAWGVSRWPLRAPSWRRHLPPLFGLFLFYSVVHTVAMEWLRWLIYPAFGLERDIAPRAVALAVGHEMPNDLFYFALFVATMELWRFWWEATERERRATELQRTLAEAQLTALRLQLQPHFLFNALNTVSATMYDDPRRADSMLGELSELLRESLRSHESDEVPLRDEIAIAERYVRLQRERFGDRLRVAFDVPAECLTARVPVLLLQPLLENAVRHGRVERQGCGEIRVTARREADALALEVWDDGDGASLATPGSGIGLRAASERLRLLYGDSGGLVSGPVTDGWRVRLTIPFREA